MQSFKGTETWPKVAWLDKSKLGDGPPANHYFFKLSFWYYMKFLSPSHLNIKAARAACRFLKSFMRIRGIYQPLVRVELHLLSSKEFCKFKSIGVKGLGIYLFHIILQRR
jgi:hypothetical protein